MTISIRTRLQQHGKKLVFALAKTYRIALGAFGTLCCIGVTGSCGKTTTKELIAAILSTQSSGRKSNRLYNAPKYVAQTIFTIFPWHSFCVHELGTQRLGMMAKSVELFRPHIGVVTHIGHDHHTTFRRK